MTHEEAKAALDAHDTSCAVCKAGAARCLTGAELKMDALEAEPLPYIEPEVAKKVAALSEQVIRTISSPRMLSHDDDSIGGE